MHPRVRTTSLFRFTIRNGSNGRLNVNPGILTDFDVDSLFFDDVGHRQRGGRLLSQTSTEDPGGTRVGTLMIGESDPDTGLLLPRSRPLRLPVDPAADRRLARQSVRGG